MTGVDISHHNTVTDFAALAHAAEFVILKATEGTGYRDPTYTSRMLQLRRLGVRVGAYHFASTGAALAEADAFLAYAKPLPGDMLALDVEAGILTRLPGQQLVIWCKQWLDHVRARTGIAPYIYMSASVVNGRDWSAVAVSYPLWVAAYRAIQPEVKWWAAPAIWQYTSTGHIVGITGNVDLDRVITAPTKPGPKPAPSAAAPNDFLEEPMKPVVFTDAYEYDKAIKAGKTDAQARAIARVEYKSPEAAFAGLGSFLSSILRDVAALKASTK